MPWKKSYTGMFWTKDGKVDKNTIMKLAFLNQDKQLAKQGKKCKTQAELNASRRRNADRERDPYNCAKLNAAMDDKGQRTPYFDAGLVQMNKGGSFSYMSTRNNNFSNRNQVGFMCVRDGNKGQCGGKTCRDTVEQDLLDKFKAITEGDSKLLEISDNSAKKTFSLDQLREAVGEEAAAQLAAKMLL